MLSISQTYVQPSRGSSSQRKYVNSSSPLPEEDNLNNVHQDEDYSKPLTKNRSLFYLFLHF